MTPCCLAATGATAVVTALVLAGLAAFVLATDGFGLGMLANLALALFARQLGWIPPAPALFYVIGLVLITRAAWLLATSRRPLVVATWHTIATRVRAALPTRSQGREVVSTDALAHSASRLQLE